MKRRLVIGAFLVLAVGIAFVARDTWLPTSDTRETTIAIPEGSSFDEIVAILDDAGLIRSRVAFRLLARTTGDDARIKPGRYRFVRGMSAAQLLRALVEGRSTLRVKLTIPEGSTIRRIASIAASQGGVDSAELVKLASSRRFLATLGIDASTAEGYLMPDTYFIFWGDEPEVLLRKMAELHHEFYSEALRNRAPAIGLTPYEVVILASIVEGEARVAEERPVVARVYLNRIRRGMKLQADPTLQYVLPDGPRRLLNADLERDTPYNTYRYAGLPPTPINNPGRESIRAVLQPDSNAYLYFVARADGSGRHTFSTNGIDHAAAVREYRRRVERERQSN